MESPHFSNSSGSSCSSSSNSSPRSDYFETQQDLSRSLDVDFEALASDAHIHRLFSPSTVNPFLDQPFFPCSPHVVDPGEFTWMEGNDFHPGFGCNQILPFPQPLEDQYFVEYGQTLTLPANSDIDIVQTSAIASSAAPSGQQQYSTSFRDTFNIPCSKTLPVSTSLFILLRLFEANPTFPLVDVENGRKATRPHSGNGGVWCLIC
jgi:hypothetical protein